MPSDIQSKFSETRSGRLPVWIHPKCFCVQSIGWKFSKSFCNMKKFSIFLILPTTNKIVNTYMANHWGNVLYSWKKWGNRKRYGSGCSLVVWVQSKFYRTVIWTRQHRLSSPRFHLLGFGIVLNVRNVDTMEIFFWISSHIKLLAQNKLSFCSKVQLLRCHNKS